MLANTAIGAISLGVCCIFLSYFCPLESVVIASITVLATTAGAILGAAATSEDPEVMKM